MPEIPMSHILDKLDLPDILILRKTCHHLRNLIDDLHPDPKIVSIIIIVDPDWIEFKITIGKGYDLYPKGKMLRIQYSVTENPENGRKVCTSQWFRSDGGRGACVDDVDFIKPFCRDFEVIFGGNTFEFSKNRENPSKIQNFILNLAFSCDINPQLLASLESILKNRPRPLPVKKFHTSVSEKAHVLQILPFFEPKTMEKISIPRVALWDLEGLSELEQWKMAKVLWCSKVHLAARVPELKNFEEIDIKLDEVKVEEVLEIKESILNSTTNLTTGRVRFEVCDGEQHFLETYGDPLTDYEDFNDPRQRWFFKMPNKKSVLQISFSHLSFQFFILQSAPDDALVI